MRITQGTFSYLPDLSDEEIGRQIAYGLERGWAVAIEFTDDPHPRNVYWHMWGMPMFDLEDPAGALLEIRRCREAFPDHYVRLSLYDPAVTGTSTALQFIVHRPAAEPGFRLERQEAHDRVLRYTLHRSAADRPHGERHGGGDR